MTPRAVPRRAVHSFVAAALLAGAGALASASPAWAAATVLGHGPERECYDITTEGRYDDRALAACDEALNGRNQLERRDRIATLVNRGIVHLRRREGTPALADFDAVIALDPRNAEAHLNRGAALVMLRQPGPAVAAITAALTFGVPEPHKAYFNRAAAREALGDLRGAYEDYTAALTIRPDWGVAEAELARFARVRRETLAARLNDSATADPQ